MHRTDFTDATAARNREIPGYSIAEGLRGESFRATLRLYVQGLVILAPFIILSRAFITTAQLVQILPVAVAVLVATQYAMTFGAGHTAVVAADSTTNEKTEAILRRYFAGVRHGEKNISLLASDDVRNTEDGTIAMILQENHVQVLDKFADEMRRGGQNVVINEEPYMATAILDLGRNGLTIMETAVGHGGGRSVRVTLTSKGTEFVQKYFLATD